MTNLKKIYPQNLIDTKNSHTTPEKQLIDFFHTKTTEQLRNEDMSEQFYHDFVEYAEKHKLYSYFLTPQEFSKEGRCFDIKTICRFMELFAYLSPSHAYSLQVTFLGIFPFLMSKNLSIKKEAIQALQNGKFFAFGLSEKEHGSDIYSSETIVHSNTNGNYIANGKKYYIGNANCAEFISVLGVKESQSTMLEKNSKEDFVFFALRPKKSESFQNVKKIRTLGVKTAFVGGFEIKNHNFPKSDIIAEGKNAWDAIFGTVNLGKFYLGFGSIGICEHAFQEAILHTKNRVLFSKPVYEMSHIKKRIHTAFIKLLAMKLFSYRAADYLSSANANDRRYLLTNSVQKAKVSTQGVEVMQILSECMGAKGFESTTHFESALRDITLIPGLEGSTHINFGIIASFIKNYFFQNKNISAPLKVEHEIENDYLFNAETGGTKNIFFPDFKESFKKLNHLDNVSIFVSQINSFKRFLISQSLTEKVNKPKANSHKLENASYYIHLGKILSTIVYAQLIAESCALEDIEEPIVESIFEQLIDDLNQNVNQLPLYFDQNTALKPLLKLALKQIIKFPNLVEINPSDFDITISKYFSMSTQK